MVQAKRLKELEKENTRLKRLVAELISGEAGAAGCGTGKLLSPERRRCAVERAWEQHGLSERHACRLLGQWRGTQRYEPIHRPVDEDALTRAIIALASEVRAIWLPEDHSVAAECGLGSGQGPGAADLAAGRAESAAKTKAARTAVAERRFLCTTEAGDDPNHVWSYDLHECQNARGENAAAADLAG